MILYFLIAYAIIAGGFALLNRLKQLSFYQCFGILAVCTYSLFLLYPEAGYIIIMCASLPLIFILLLMYGFQSNNTIASKYRVKFALESDSFSIQNLKRGVSITGAAGSGKTESVVYNFLKHLSRNNFCGIIHDYKNFELTELAYPLFKNSDLPFKIISFDPVYHKVNPIAPQYLPDEESVNEIARVLMENLLEQKEQYASGTTRFFNDAVEGIICGMIWNLKTHHPKLCTLPHLIALYQRMNSDQLIEFLSSDITSRAMADAFISGIDSERQTAAVKGTLANAFKRITTRKIFFCLSGHDISLDLNNPKNPAVVTIVNNPKNESAYSPVIAMILHTVIKQMSVRDRKSAFILMEEAPTIRLLHMHRVPATLRSYDIATLYILQDKVQNDLLYGEKASKAILANLSYQFFGKVNDPVTAAYYEKFFELVKRDTVSISKGEGLNFDTRITKTKREVSKLRADLFFRLKPGEFVAYADGKEKKVRFKYPKIQKALPGKFKHFSKNELDARFASIYTEVEELLNAAKK
ncbi:Type IV secretion-system coupling protein DNA-binding domain-containing protein [Salegentibacter agarivorans]|uniref:Type IV secretion-system coupling protein DNA-binding domain-containing protein n=1 Tax=Salegentibacter agarivorans TaxID=345907 RepID=A0A1I2KNU4_9FLAO|nr:type IV secretion system DNA-binding domain-containing protein [Salegentibacter agarivorans]SFF68615.1 Type IV secretion-system coupling protein DNA-binding domain-containing protein [Salegentibacter agarivorans]